MDYIIKGQKTDWEVIIGLEVHCQVISKSKLFSGASTCFGSEPNTQVSFIDAGFPGMLPVINEFCIEQAVKTGLGLNAKINHKSIFARKNYFYADLPQGYQISQYESPLIGEGVVTIDLPEGKIRSIGIERLHLEQDAGKSIHDQHPAKSMIDLNRSGIALMEIVTKPDLRSPEEVGAFLRKLRSIVRYLDTCDGNMEEGSMRCDVNVSVRPIGEKTFRPRCEMKNINSVRFAMQAVEVEAKRHIEVYENDEKIEQETRRFDPVEGITYPLRNKENAHDYRYFPDPDLLPLELKEGFVAQIKNYLPELPDQKKERFIREYGLSVYDACILVAERETAVYFEKTAQGRDAKKSANWIIGDLFAVLNRMAKHINDSPVSADNLGRLIDLIADETISGRIAKEVFEIMAATGKNPIEIVKEKGLKQVTDTNAITNAIEKIITANQDKAEEYRQGKDKLLGWFVGQVMKEMKGKANPALLNELLKKKLDV